MTHSFPTRRSADLERVAVRPGRASSSRTKTTSIAAPTTRAPPTSSTRKSAARPTNSRCASVNQNRKIMADDDYVYDEASGEWLPASDIAARDAAEAAGTAVRVAVGHLLADGEPVVLVKDLHVKGAGQTLN